MTDAIVCQTIRLAPQGKTDLDYEYEIVADPALPDDQSEPLFFRAMRADGVVLEQRIDGRDSLTSRGLTLRLNFGGIPVLGDYEYQQHVDGGWRTLTRFWHPPRADRANA